MLTYLPLTEIPHDMFNELCSNLRYMFGAGLKFRLTPDQEKLTNMPKMSVASDPTKGPFKDDAERMTCFMLGYMAATRHHPTK